MINNPKISANAACFATDAAPSSVWQRIAGSPLYLALLLALSCTALYSKFLWAPPVFDDLYFFNNSALQQLGHDFSPWRLRWLPIASLEWTLMALGRNVLWLHLGNLLLHIANAILLMLFLWQLFAIVVKPEREAATSSLFCAFLGAMIFAFHPVSVYSTEYLVQRSTLMALLFSLMALHCVLKGVTGKGQIYYWLAAACYFGAVFAKEHAVMLPAVALVLIVLLKRPSVALLKQLSLPGGLFLMIGCAVVLQVKSEGVIGQAYQVDGGSLLERTLGAAATHGHYAYALSVITQGLLFFKYWLLWLIPNPGWMSVDMYEPFATRFLSWPQLPGLIAYVLYGCLGVFLLFKRGLPGLLGFALLVPWLMFATEFSTVRVQEPFVLYRSYLWMAIPIGCLPLFLWRIVKSRAFIYLGIVIFFLVPLSINRLQTFSHSLLLWDDAARLAEEHAVFPGTERLYYNRANALFDLKMYPQAMSDYTHAIQINPTFAYAYANRGLLFHQLGRDDQALADIDFSLKLKPDYGFSWWNRGLTLMVLKRPLEARGSFAQACKQGMKAACLKVGNLS